MKKLVLLLVILFIVGVCIPSSNPIVVSAAYKTPVTAAIYLTDTTNISSSNQRKLWYWEDTLYVFWTDYSNTGWPSYSYSNDNGQTWESPINIPDFWSDAEDWDIYVSDNYVYMASSADDYGLQMAMGSISDSGITWLNYAQTVVVADFVMEPSICVDSSGYTWVEYSTTSVSTNTYVVKLSNAGGPGYAFSVEADFPYLLSTNTSPGPIVPVGANGVICFYFSSSGFLAGRRNNGSWQAEQNLATGWESTYLSSVSVGTKAYVAIQDSSTYNMDSYIYDSATDNFGSLASVSMINGTIPSLSYDGIDLYCIEFDGPSSLLYYYTYDFGGNSWSLTADPWIDELNDNGFEMSDDGGGHYSILTTPYTNGELPAAAWVANDYGMDDSQLRVCLFGQAPLAPGVPDDPYNLAIASSTATTISLTWSIGDNATETLIRRKLTPFTGDATAVTEGTYVYKGTDNNCTAVGLTQGTTYYFRAWSWAT